MSLPFPCRLITEQLGIEIQRPAFAIGTIIRDGKETRISGSRSVRFLEKRGFWFGSFLLGSGSFPSLTSCAGGRHNMPRPCKLTFDLLTLTVVYESRVTRATSVPILVFLGLSVLDLGPMYQCLGCVIMEDRSFNRGFPSSVRCSV